MVGSKARGWIRWIGSDAKVKSGKGGASELSLLRLYSLNCDNGVTTVSVSN